MSAGIAVVPDPTGKLTLFITAQVLILDESSGRPQIVKLWERTGEVGSTTRQALAQGNMSSNLKKKIDEFFSKLRTDILAARKAQEQPAAPK